MTPEQERQYREEFEGLDESDHLNFLKDSQGGYVYDETFQAWKFYLAACKKRQEEIDRLEKSDSIRFELVLSHGQEIQRLKEEIADLKHGDHHKYCDKMISDQDLEIHKRDKLLEQCLPWLEYVKVGRESVQKLLKEVMEVLK